MESTPPGADMGGSAPGKSVVVADGTVVWFYLPESNRYGSIAASELTADAPGDLGDASPAAMDTFMMWRYRGAAGFNAVADFLREEAIEFAGAKVACYVVSVSQKKRWSLLHLVG
jgi:outer membrane lipoprotein-sorting protein